MTVLKTCGVVTASFARLQRYIEREGKWAGTRCLNIADERDWAREMDQTLTVENVAVRTKKRGYHAILAFNPDEVRPRDADGEIDRAAFGYALDYSVEFARRAYPGCQVAAGAHLERCDADGTERVAVHIAVCRAVIEEGEYPDGNGHIARTGTLFDRSPSVARAQVRIVRDLDGQAGFRQLRRGENVAALRVRGTSKEERRMRERGQVPYKDSMRAALLESVEGSRSLAELASRMGERGFSLDTARSKANITVVDADGHRARVSTLGATREAIEARLRENAAAAIIDEARARRLEECAGISAPKAAKRRERVAEGDAHRYEAQRGVAETSIHASEPLPSPCNAVPGRRPSGRTRRAALVSIGLIARRARGGARTDAEACGAGGHAGHL